MAEVGGHLAGLGRQVTGADEVALSVLGFFGRCGPAGCRAAGTLER